MTNPLNNLGFALRSIWASTQSDPSPVETGHGRMSRLTGVFKGLKTYGKPLNVEQQLNKVSVLKERWRHLRMVNVAMTCPLAVIKSITGDAMYFYLSDYFYVFLFFNPNLVVHRCLSVFGPGHHIEAVLCMCLVLASPEILSK